MDNDNLKLAQKDVEDALNAIEDMEATLTGSDISKELLKERFLFLTKKVEQLENLLLEEGILK
jgi:hypothetical protein